MTITRKNPGNSGLKKRGGTSSARRDATVAINRAGADPAMQGRPVAAKGDARRTEILAVARRCLVDDGYECFVLREIAQHVGVSVGNLQYYYATRDDLLEAVVRAEFEMNRSDIRRISALSSPPRERLAAIAEHLLHVWAADGGRVYAVMSLLALHNDRFCALHEEVYRAFYAGLMPVLKELQPAAKRAGLLRTARLITTLIDGALVQVPTKTFLSEVVRVVLQLADPRAQSDHGQHRGID